MFDHIIKIGHYDRMYNIIAYKLAGKFAEHLIGVGNHDDRKIIDQDLILQLFYPDSD